MNLAKAKETPDKYSRKVATLSARSDLQSAKWIQKHGTQNVTLGWAKEIYGSKLTADENVAIGMLESSAEKGRQRIAYVKAVAIPTLSTAAVAAGIQFVGEVLSRR